MKKGALCISLDFEKFWGIHDVANLKDVEQNMLKVSGVVTDLLALFNKYDIHCTWAVVGLLNFENLEALSQTKLSNAVSYIDVNLSPLPVSKFKLDDFSFDAFLAQTEIQQIKNTKHQELASHTFSHFYCLEKGITKIDFKKDIDLFKQFVATDVKSIVFPRNQIDENCLKVCAENGMTSYRGNQPNRFWKNTAYTNEKLSQKIGRTLDAYIKITKDNFSDWKTLGQKSKGMVNIPASRFFKPAKFPGFIERLKLKRIKKQMLESAKTNTIYHLWWHPHNFTSNTEANFKQLETIFVYYQQLVKDYDYQSLNMNEIAKQVD